jgi:hypothetical protein
MSFVGKAIGGLVGGITGATAAAQGAQEAARTQAAASQAGIDEQRRQFDALVQIMSPFVQAGTGALEQFAPFQQAGEAQLGNLGQIAGAGMTALQQQQALTGGLGPEAQRQAIAMLEQSPQFAAMTQQGENALLQSASATGGLRGGNIQGALAQFRPQVLSSLIEQQYARLGGLTDLGALTAQNLVFGGQAATENLANLGQASAAGQGAAGLRSAGAIGDLLGAQGAATAGGQLARSGRDRAAFGDLLSIGCAVSGFF